MNAYLARKDQTKMKKQLFKLTSTIALSLTCMLVWGQTAEAYIDPSVATYVIQAVAGIIIAAGAIVGIYWRKAKKKINKTLGVDENKNKEIESDDIIVKTEKTEDSGKAWTTENLRNLEDFRPSERG